jgi:glycosyltransferase involved in cell wall biosynthesis
MRRPSVLFLNRVYPPAHGATGRVLRDLARSFAREGWQVTVVTTGEKAAKERDGGIRVIRIKASQNPSNIFVYLSIWLRLLVTALRMPATHLLVTMSDPPLLIVAGQIIKRFKKNRHINWCHDLYPDIFPALGFPMPGFVMNFFKGLTRRAMADSDKVIVIGRCMARQLSLSGIDPRLMTMIPNWPDFELFTPTQEQNLNGTAHAAMAINGFKSHEDQLKVGPKFRVLYAGNIGRAHPVDTILGAAEILNEENPEIEFVFVGEGSRFDDLVGERTRRGLDNIRLMPYQPINRLREVMESGDVHLVSVKEEAAGFLVPSKLYAALAVGRPCIFLGPVQSEAAKVIMDFKAGVVLPQGDARQLADAIKTFRMNSESWFEAQTGAASAGQIFVPQEAIDAWIERAWHVVEPDLRAA